MPNEIVTAGTVLTYFHTEFSHGTELMETREDNHRLSILIVISFDEVLYQVQYTVCLEYALPHISHRVFAFDRWIYTVLIEGKELGVCTLQLGGHEHIVVVHHKVNQTMFQHSVLRIAVIAILVYTIGVVLVRAFVLQFEGEQRQTVKQNAHIEFVATVSTCRAIAHLANDAECIGSIELVCFAVCSRQNGLELSKLNTPTLYLEAFAE